MQKRKQLVYLVAEPCVLAGVVVAGAWQCDGLAGRRRLRDVDGERGGGTEARWVVVDVGHTDDDAQSRVARRGTRRHGHVHIADARLSARDTRARRACALRGRLHLSP